MGLESQLTNVSSESIPILLFASLSSCACYLRARISTILRRIGILSSRPEIPETYNSTSDLVGSGLAKLVLLAEQLNLNRVFSYKYKNNNKNTNDDGDDVISMKCVVCLNCLDDGDDVRKLACRHVFHKRCFDGWLDQMKFNCPLCRADLISEERVECTRRMLGEDGVTWFSSLR